MSDALIIIAICVLTTAAVVGPLAWIQYRLWYTASEQQRADDDFASRVQQLRLNKLLPDWKPAHSLLGKSEALYRLHKGDRKMFMELAQYIPLTPVSASTMFNSLRRKVVLNKS